jgi:hypothetical protein
MKHFLFTVEQAVEIGGRGLVVLGPPYLAVRGLKVGDALGFWHDDNTWVRTRIAGLELAFPNPKGQTGWLLPPDVQRGRVRPGMKVWTDVEGVQVVEFNAATAALRALEVESKRLLDYWWVLLQPSFEPEAVVAAARTEDGLIGLLQVSPQDPFSFRAAAAVPLPGWEDPVARVLSDTALLAPPADPRAGGGVLDGIGYLLKVRNRLGEATLQFSNPRSEPLRRLERAIAGATGEIASRSADVDVKAYYAKLRPYFR